MSPGRIRADTWPRWSAVILLVVAVAGVLALAYWRETRANHAVVVARAAAVSAADAATTARKDARTTRRELVRLCLFVARGTAQGNQRTRLAKTTADALVSSSIASARSLRAAALAALDRNDVESARIYLHEAARQEDTIDVVRAAAKKVHLRSPVTCPAAPASS